MIYTPRLVLIFIILLKLVYCTAQSEEFEDGESEFYYDETSESDDADDQLNTLKNQLDVTKFEDIINLLKEKQKQSTIDRSNEYYEYDSPRRREKVVPDVETRLDQLKAKLNLAKYPPLIDYMKNKHDARLPRINTYPIEHEPLKKGTLTYISLCHKLPKSFWTFPYITKHNPFSWKKEILVNLWRINDEGLEHVSTVKRFPSSEPLKTSQANTVLSHIDYEPKVTESNYQTVIPKYRNLAIMTGYKFLIPHSNITVNHVSKKSPLDALKMKLPLPIITNSYLEKLFENNGRQLIGMEHCLRGHIEISRMLKEGEYILSFENIPYVDHHSWHLQTHIFGPHSFKVK